MEGKGPLNPEFKVNPPAAPDDSGLFFKKAYRIKDSADPIFGEQKMRALEPRYTLQVEKRGQFGHK